MKLTIVGPNQTEVELTTQHGDTVTLFFSYETLVALHLDGVGFYKTAKYWSKTTSRHINSFLDRATPKIVEQDELESFVIVTAKEATQC